VLDSWVRYESQVKQRQQKELAQSIIAKVQKELENPKVLQQILQQSVADVESRFRLDNPQCLVANRGLQESSLPRLNRRLLRQSCEARFPLLYQCRYTPMCISPNSTSSSLACGSSFLPPLERPSSVPVVQFCSQYAVVR
jgi:hypothetical protein